MGSYLDVRSPISIRSFFEQNDYKSTKYLSQLDLNKAKNNVVKSGEVLENNSISSGQNQNSFFDIVRKRPSKKAEDILSDINRFLHKHKARNSNTMEKVNQFTDEETKEDLFDEKKDIPVFTKKKIITSI